MENIDQDKTPGFVVETIKLLSFCLSQVRPDRGDYFLVTHRGDEIQWFITLLGLRRLLFIPSKRWLFTAYSSLWQTMQRYIMIYCTVMRMEIERLPGLMPGLYSVSQRCTAANDTVMRRSINQAIILLVCVHDMCTHTRSSITSSQLKEK